jgi:hypothetical protein
VTVPTSVRGAVSWVTPRVEMVLKGRVPGKEEQRLCHASGMPGQQAREGARGGPKDWGQQGTGPTLRGQPGGAFKNEMRGANRSRTATDGSV